MKLLHLEDNPRDAALVRDVLSVDWPECAITVVATRDDFIRELAAGGHDLIISDYRLPGFNGLEALELVRERAPDVPFIFFSGTLGEERAIEAVRAGAADYVIKDRMQRLPISVQRVLRENAEQKARSRSETALAQEQYLLRILMENVPDNVYFKDAESRLLSVSRAMARRHGVEPSQLRGKTDFDLFTTEHAQQAFDDEQRIMRTGEPILDKEEKETCPDGTVTWVSTTKLPLRDSSGLIVGTFGVSRDITARKQIEDRLHEQAEILDHAPIAIVITDLAHRVIYANDGAAAFYGLPKAKMQGLTAEEIFTVDSAGALTKAQVQADATGHWTGEVALTTHAGRELHAEFHMSLINDAAGRPKARLSVALDITEKKKLEEQFLRAQRLESLGMLAAGIAHDLNNILAPVLMGAPLLRIRASHPSDLRVLDTIESSAGRGAALVRQILSFAHGTSGDKALIQPKHLLRDVAGLMEQTFPKNITLEEDIPNDLWTLQGNPTQLHQVLLNLCVNARDAMPRGGTLRLVAENRRMDAVTGGSTGQHTVAGAYVMLEVADTGTGIPPAILDRIWDPFFTTKAEGKGTGLGLATVRGIAANHGGFVRVDSAADRGTVFQVFIPACDQAATDIGSATAHPFQGRGQGELILLVDDEDSIRDLGTAVLGRYGYRVLVAANGTEAMALYAPRAGEVALVITDVIMPEMGGGELALALSHLNPDVKILFMSGNGAKPSPEDGLPPNAHILIKPFAVDKLVKAVRTELEGKPA